MSAADLGALAAASVVCFAVGWLVGMAVRRWL